MQILMFILIIVGAISFAMTMNSIIEHIYHGFLWKRLMNAFKDEETRI